MVEQGASMPILACFCETIEQGASMPILECFCETLEDVQRWGMPEGGRETDLV